MIRIAVLDSCVLITHPVFSKKHPIVYQFISNKWTVTQQYQQKNLYSHGTAICGIIAQQTEDNKDIEIINFDVYDPNPHEFMKKTLSALSFISGNLECNIINMSVGVRTNNIELKNICEKISNKGITIVSSFDNAGAISYPAAYPFVIGVDSSPRCTHADDFVFVENSPINIRAKGGVQRVAWTNPLFTVNEGNSFAAPYVTSYIAKLYAKGFSKEEALEYIKEKSRFIYKSSTIDQEDSNFFISKAVLFPFNKEMQSLITFRQHLPFEICEICDIKYSGHLGLPIAGLFDETPSYRIKSINDINWDSIDTVIIGHTSELEGITENSVKSEMLQFCLEHRKNVYSFDDECIDEYYQKFKNNGLFLSCPKKVNVSIKNNFGKLYLLRRPVLGIFGTTKQQGKFTLQLQLRYALQNLGYDVGQLGSEPSSKLFNMDEVYPFGYNGLSENNLSERIEEVNYLMHKIDEKEPDIILVGSQSGIIPRGYYNIGQITLYQIAFLMGTKPDAIILCVNIDDSEDHINRTINIIENLIHCKVIALAVYPMKYSNGWGIIQRKKHKASNEVIMQKLNSLREVFNIPVALIGEKEDEDVFVSACLKFFGGKRDE